VLYVDSDPADVLMIQESIAQVGAPVRLHVARDGNQAPGFVRRAGEFRGALRSRLILLELELPGVSGLDVLAELKGDRDLMTIPVIIVSSSRDPMYVQGSYALHVGRPPVRQRCALSVPCRQVLIGSSAYRHSWRERDEVPEAAAAPHQLPAGSRACHRVP
jgi:CheY-like chemotaxis protein